MVAWALTLLAMKGYELTGKRMEEIQEVNNQRKKAIAAGMTMEEAMEKYK
jgi:Na+/melibiose symporter-like transporter